MDVKDLQLGDKIYESMPWERKVCERTVDMITTREWISFNGRRDSKREVRCTGVFLGQTVVDWGKRFFDNERQARAAMLQQAAEMEESERKQIESEIRKLQEKLTK